MCLVSSGCLDKKRVCDPWARLGFCERRKAFMKKNCPRRCDLCYGELGQQRLLVLNSADWFCTGPVLGFTVELCCLQSDTNFKLTSCLDLVPTSEPLEVVATPTPASANIKVKMVPRGKVVGFRCGTKSLRSPSKVRSAGPSVRFRFQAAGIDRCSPTDPLIRLSSQGF